VPTDNTSKVSSFDAGERMQELVKVCDYLTPSTHSFSSADSHKKIRILCDS